MSDAAEHSSGKYASTLACLVVHPSHDLARHKRAQPAPGLELGLTKAAAAHP